MYSKTNLSMLVGLTMRSMVEKNGPEWDLVLTLGAYTKHEAHKLWSKFVSKKGGGLTKTQNREL